MSETPLVSVKDIRRSANHRKLFDGLSLGVFEKEKVGLIGPNGSGKSTLLKILAGVEEADSGQRVAQKQLVLGYVPQDIRFPDNATVNDLLGWSLRRSALPPEEAPAQLSMGLNRLGLKGETVLSTLSGGWQKKVAIIAELIKKPGLLLMDEPTNHLDLESIKWLEKELRQFRGAVLVISHDRSFLENICNRMIELHRRYPEGYFDCEGNYSLFLQRRSEFLMAQHQYEQSLANKVRREIDWLRQGVKARTTKSKARIKNVHDLAAELEATHERLKERTTKIEFSATGKKSERLIEVEKMSYGIADKKLFEDFEMVLRKGDRIGLVGANGCGKSTLLKLLSKKLQPESGSIAWAEGQNVVYFEQDRTGLNGDLSLQDNLAPDSDAVIFQGRSVHVASYARRFLFGPEHLNLPVKRLSGGEQARLLIAKLMLEPADVLLLDEPTNDLDIETMDVFAENLMAFPGAIVLVSHDRFFLEQICDKFIVIDEGKASDVYASISQWEAEKARSGEEDKPVKVAKKRFKPKKRLSYNEKREWEQMEEKILVAEEALESWKTKVEDPTTAASPGDLKEAFEKMSEAQSLVDHLYERWAELEKQQDG